MFIILTYDVGEKRVNKIRKCLKKYLTWTQNSVFEGEITKGMLNKCLADVNKNLIKEEDSLYIYIVRNSNNVKKEVVGKEKNYDDLFI